MITTNGILAIILMLIGGGITFPLAWSAIKRMKAKSEKEQNES